MHSVFANLILDVENVEKSVGFYRDRLGFVVHSVGELDGHRLASISASGFEILLLQQPAADQPRIHERGKGLVMNFQVNGLPEVARRLKQAHVPVLQDLAKAVQGEQTLLITDPDGYAILLSEPAGTVH
jgi:predicted enzyme related to lactoylglutathione lyase